MNFEKSEIDSKLDIGWCIDQGCIFYVSPQGGELYFTFSPPPGGGEIKMKFLNIVVLSYCSV